MKAFFTQGKFTNQFMNSVPRRNQAARFVAPVLLGLLVGASLPGTVSAKSLLAKKAAAAPAPARTGRKKAPEQARPSEKLAHASPRTPQATSEKLAHASPRTPRAAQATSKPRSLPRRVGTKVETKSAEPTPPKSEKLELSVYSAEAQRSIGAISVGHPNVGFLINGVALQNSPYWVVTVPQHRFGTEETILGLTRAISTVQEQFPHSPPVMIGSISPEGGGYAPPHKSHRTGRDVDVYFYRTEGSVWFKPPTHDEIDYPRSWALLKAFLTQTPIDYVLLDRELQTWFREYAASIGEDPAWLKQMFEGEGRYPNPAVKHEPGHNNHFHVRFASPIARERGRLLYDRLVAQGHLPVKGQELAGAKEPVMVAHFPKPGEKASSVADALSGLTAIEQEFDESLRACDPPLPVTAQQR